MKASKVRPNFIILFVVAFLTACTSTPTNATQHLTYREQLDIYKGMKIRMYQVARSVLASMPVSCGSTKLDDGNLYHSLSDYPPRMRAVAANYWGLNNTKIVLYTGIKSTSKTCAVPVVLAYENEANAYTDGERVFVTPALLKSVDDLALSLIIAHELGHIVLAHADEQPSEALEREADRFALFVLARAGLDYHAAVLEQATSQLPHANGKHTKISARKRAEYFTLVVTEIDTLRATGEALVP